MSTEFEEEETGTFTGGEADDSLEETGTETETETETETKTPEVIPSTPQVSLDQLPSLISQGVREAMQHMPRPQVQAPAPVQPTTPWGEKPGQYWVTPEGMPAEQQGQWFHNQVMNAVEHIVGQKVNPLQDGLNMVRGQVQVIDQLKATDPVKSQIAEDAYKLVNSGQVNDLSVAFQVAKVLRGQSTEAPTNAPVSAKPKPVPKGTASTPRGRKVAPVRRRGLPDFEALYAKNLKKGM